MSNTVEKASKRSIWQLLGGWLKAFDKDCYPTHDDWQDRRIAALQKEMAEVRLALAELQKSGERRL